MTDPESEDFREMLRRFLENGEEFDIEKFAKAAGLPGDPQALQAMMAQLQAALAQGGPGITEQLVRDTATKVANARAVSVDSPVGEAATTALNLASLWLDEVTSISPLTATPTLMTRPEWARATLAGWISIAEPVANSIANATERLLTEQLGDDTEAHKRGALDALSRLSGSLFSIQLGQVVGQLASEVTSGSDLGFPLLDGSADYELRAVLIPQNVAAFADGLDTPMSDVLVYLAAREIAHARLFKHAKWLKLGLISSITDYANGISINSERIREVMDDVDLSDPQAIQRLMGDGALIPPKTDAQRAALARIETLLALVDGWVDVVTDQAVSRLPTKDSIAEMVRRNRATGRPGEKALAGLIGIEARPRRLREAAALWRAIDGAVGKEVRDSLWAHPDILPTSADIDDPGALIARLTGPVPAPDALDDELRKILDEGTVDEG